MSQQLLVGFSPNFKLRLRWPNKHYNVWKEDNHQWKTTLKGRRPQILKVKYFINYWLDPPKILKLGLSDQHKHCLCFEGRRPQIEHNLKWKTTSNRRRHPQILKVHCLNNYWLDVPQILNLGSCDQTNITMFERKTTSNGRRP